MSDGCGWSGDGAGDHGGAAPLAGALAGGRGRRVAPDHLGQHHARPVAAFEGLQGGELALLALPVLRALHAQGISLSLADVVEQLDELGVSAIAIGGIADDASLAPGERQALAEAAALAEERGMPLLALASATLNEVEHDLIAHLMTRRARQPQSAEPSAADAARLRAGLRSEALETLLTGTYASEAAM